jgi:hypothetical protein
MGPTPVVNVLGDGSPISSKLDGTCLSGVCPGSGELCTSNADCPGFYGPASWFTASNQNSLNCDYPATVNEFVSGVTITAVDTWDEDGNGSIGTVYVQDTIGLDDWTKIPAFAATSVYEASYSPPDLRPEPGDIVDITGQYEEFQGPSTFIFPQCVTLPQMGGDVTLRGDGRVPPPVQLNPSDLGNIDGDVSNGARAYLSMLVTVNNVEIGGSGSEDDGRYGANVIASPIPWQISDELWDVYHLCPLSQGQTFKSVTGIVTYFGTYHVAPRSGLDFDPPCGPMADGGTGG